MVAITRFTLTGFAVLSTLSSVLAAPTPLSALSALEERDVVNEAPEVRDVTEFITPVTFDIRDFEEDLPLEARDILSGTHDEFAIVNKRSIFGKLFGGVVKGIGKLVHRKHHRSLDDDAFTIAARDIMAAFDPVIFDTRDLSEDVPYEVRDILAGNHDDYAVVNKRSIFGKLFGGVVKGIGKLVHRKHHH